MEELKKYAVVHHKEERDVYVASIDAMSFKEAREIFEKRYVAEKEAMKMGELMMIIETEEKPVFDSNNRVVITSGDMDIIVKF